MSEGYVRELTALLVAVGTGIAWLVHRWDKARKAIPRDTADMARAVEDAPEAATQAVEKALDVVTASLVEDLARVRADAARDRSAATRDRERHRADRERIERLEQADADKGTELGRLRSQVLRLAGVLSRDVTSVLDWIEGGAKPPPPHDQVRILRDVIRDLDRDT